MITFAILGYGTVGSGVAEVFWTNREVISRRVKDEIRLKYVLDLREFPGDPVEPVLVHDFAAIVKDPEVKIVAETMGGTGAAYTFVKQCLEAGKHVCTSNKALVAAYGSELMRIAAEKGVHFLFEASCGGGIPIIRAINGSLTADVLDEVTGILNGTTNFMLDRMEREGRDFQDVLKEAQSLGYAEADPTADVEGHDAGRKIAILSSLAYGQQIHYEDVLVEGITRITPEDMQYAKAIGCSVHLLGSSRRTEEGCYALVAPFMVPRSNPLYAVNGVLNAVFVHGNMLGDAMFYGSGAGKLPTASAVAADIIDCAMHLEAPIPCDWSDEEAALLDPRSVKGRFFVRALDTSEMELEEVFGPGETVELDQLTEEIGFITGEMTLGEYETRSAKLGSQILSMIRMKE